MILQTIKPVLLASILGASLASPAAAQSCAARNPFPIYTTFSFFARKVLVSPNGQFVAFSTRTSDGSVVELRVKRLGFSGTAAVFQSASSAIWNQDMDFVWGPNSDSITFTAPPTSGSVIDRSSIRRATFNGSSWSTPQVLLNPSTLTWSSMRLVHSDGTTVWGSFIGTTGNGILFSLTPPPNPPAVQPTVITFTNVPNLQWQAHDSVTVGGALRILCSERNTTNNSTQYFRLDAGLFASSRVDLGGTVTQTIENLRHSSFSGATDVVLIESSNRIALHGVGQNNNFITTTGRVAPAGGGAWNLYLRTVNSNDFRPNALPTLGGGEVELRDTPAHSIFPSIPNAAPSTDVNNTVIAYMSGGWVYTTILDREIRATDKAVTNSTLNVTMDVGAGLSGVLSVGFATAVTPTPVPGICSALLIDSPITLVSGTGTLNALPFVIPPGNVGVRLFYQGVRFSLNPTAGDFSRVAIVEIF